MDEHLLANRIRELAARCEAQGIYTPEITEDEEKCLAMLKETANAVGEIEQRLKGMQK